MADIVYVERILIGKVNTVKIIGVTKVNDNLIGKVKIQHIRGIAELG